MAFWFGLLFLLLGIILLAMIPVIIHTMRTNPMALLREQWHDASSPGFAYALGGLVVILALAGGAWAVYVGVAMLF